MTKRFFVYSILSCCLLVLSGCSAYDLAKVSLVDSNKNVSTSSESEIDSKIESMDNFSMQNLSEVLAPQIIYRTKKDYSKKVSVQLGADEKITSFPGPSDAIHQYPIELEGGYLLKKMTGNVFLSVDIEDFVKSSDWMHYIDKKFIIDYDPFVEMYECSQVAGDEEGLNRLILNKELSKCKKLK